MMIEPRMLPYASLGQLRVGTANRFDGIAPTAIRWLSKALCLRGPPNTCGLNHCRELLVD